MNKRKYLIAVSIAFAMALMLISNTQASIGLPDYDSGWQSINQGQQLTLTHNLGTTEVLVYAMGNHSIGRIHQIDYGDSDSQGLFWWHLNDTTIDIYRRSSNDYWTQFRVIIWKIEAQPQGVGGLTVPVDRLALFVPYLALVATLILAVSISVAIIKTRKKQRTTIISLFIQSKILPQGIKTEA